MPVEHHIADDASITTVQVSGSVVPDELQAGVEALIADPGYDPALPLLVDLRGMEIELDCRALEPFNGFVIEHLGLSRAASMAERSRTIPNMTLLQTTGSPRCG